MKLTALFSAERVRVNVAVRSKKHAIELAAENLASAFASVSVNNLFDAMIARERLGCTTLGHGVALPHAALPGLQTSAASVIKFAEPIIFDEDDSTPVSLMVAMVVPVQTQSADNDELQQACDLLSNRERRLQLLGAASETQLLAALRGEAPAPRLKQARG
ncbi:MAG: PTS sugar transporter subunit IIA [Gammaproteobacteria bacterium]